MQKLQGLSPIINQYQAFICDLWGVIHDGISLYPGVKECLEQLRDHNKTVIFLSNAPRRATRVIAQLHELGISQDLYHAVVTSGDVVYELCQTRSHSLFNTIGKRVMLIGSEDDMELLDGLEYDITSDAGQADFAIAIGFNHDHSTLEEKQPQLDAALDNQLPLLCANPDKVVIRHSGAQALCAGVMADYYIRQGGYCLSVGKPYPLVYEQCLQLFRKYLPDINSSSIAAIGDNLDTDIEGGNQAGIDTMLVSSGVIGKQMDLSFGENLDISQLENLCAKNQMPRYVLPSFCFRL